MATYYADFDLGTGDNDGTSWANAWKTMADAIAGNNGTAPAAGDTVYCRGTDTLSATCTNALNGDETTGLIKWIGVNSSGNNDGTRTIIEGGATANYAILTLNGNYNLYENFGFTGSDNNDGVEGSGDYNVFINCASYNNNLYGFYLNGITYTWFFRCVAYSNGNGFYSASINRFIFCTARDNTTDGFNLTGGGGIVCIGCLSFDNNGDGINNLTQGTLAFNCVANGNGNDGIMIRSVATGLSSCVIGCRITNQSGDAADIGLNANTEICLYGWNYIFNNGDNVADDTLAYAITHNGTATNTIATEGAAAANIDGYTSITDPNQDFNLASDATLRRTAITIPTS